MRYRRSFLYFCLRDNIVYDPRQGTPINPSDVKSYLLDGVEGKYCLTQMYLDKGMRSGWYFIAWTLSQDKTVTELARVSPGGIFWAYQRIKIDERKPFVELVNQLERDGWQPIEKGIVSYEESSFLSIEWLFMRG